VKEALPGETYIPNARAARLLDLAEALIGNRSIEIKKIGIRPGEKIHEILISEEEAYRTIKRNNYYVIEPMLPELTQKEVISQTMSKEFSSADNCMHKEELVSFLTHHQLMIDQCDSNGTELLR